jgi:hypothetical protein
MQRYVDVLLARQRGCKGSTTGMRVKGSGFRVQAKKDAGGCFFLLNPEL